MTCFILQWYFMKLSFWWTNSWTTLFLKMICAILHWSLWFQRETKLQALLFLRCSMLFGEVTFCEVWFQQGTKSQTSYCSGILSSAMVFFFEVWFQQETISRTSYVKMVFLWNVLSTNFIFLKCPVLLCSSVIVKFILTWE